MRFFKRKILNYPLFLIFIFPLITLLFSEKIINNSHEIYKIFPQKISSENLKIKIYRDLNLKNISKENNLTKSELTVIEKNSIALVLIRPHITEQNTIYWKKRKENNLKTIVPITKIFKNNNFPIYYTAHAKYDYEHTYLFDTSYAQIINPKINNVMRKIKLFHLLGIKKIKTVFVAGYSLNSCVVRNPISIFSLRDAGFNVIFIKDATLPVKTIENKDFSKYFNFHLEKLGIKTTTTADLINSLSKKS